MSAPDTIPHRLLQQAAKTPSAIAYQSKVDGRWQPTTWQTYAEQVRTAARALIALGFPRGGKVAILGFNRPEWVIFDQAVMMAGGAAAGIYTTCSPDEVQYIVHHSEAHAILVEDAGQLAKVMARRDKLPLLRSIVLMSEANHRGVGTLPASPVGRGSSPVESTRGAESKGEGVLSWDDFNRKAEGAPQSELDARLDALEPSALATLIYTSGTTGPPKGVMLSHANIAWTSRMLLDVEGPPDGVVDVTLSYLPLSHIAEQMGTVHVSTTAGSTVYFAESLDKLPENLRDARPTVFFGVPRIWEKFHAGLAAKLGEVKGGKRKLVDWARRVCTEVNAHRDRGTAIPRLLAMQYALASKLVIGKIKAALGFDRARALLSGAAPIAPDVLAFFASIDLPIREIYGQSEDSGPTSYNLFGRTRIGSVGSPLPGIEVKIAEDGEILVRGPNVFVGYYKEPEATAEALKDGWLCSGDLGAIDKDGFLTITGRKKEIIITAGGKNISPKNIEASIKQSPIVGEAVVIGDRRKYLVALVTLDEEAAKKLVPHLGDLGDASKLCSAPQIQAAIQQQIDETNKELARVEQIKKFSVLGRPFGITTGELTPTMKIKRKVIAEMYQREIEAMYADGE